MLMRGHTGIKETLQIAEAVYVSPVVLGELHAGFRRGARRKENEKLLSRFLASPRVETIPVGADTALCYAQIFEHLRAAGRPIPTNDIWIAAGAMERGLTVVTTGAHFGAIPHIRLDHHQPLKIS